MANNKDKCVLYWGKRKYQLSVMWEPNTKTGRFLPTVGTYQYHIFSNAIEADIWNTMGEKHVFYQVTHVIPPENEDPDTPTTITDKREKNE